MATKLKQAEIESFVGGINVYANSRQVKDNESPDMLNCMFEGISGITKRQGYIKLTTSLIASGYKGQGLFEYVTATSKEILYVVNGVLYKYNGSGGSTTITGGTFSTSANVNACQMGDRLYFADGVTALSYYDGSAISTTGIASAPTKVKQLIKYNNRMYCNSDDAKDRVYYGGSLGTDGTATNTGNFATTTPAFAGYLGFGRGKIVTGFAKKDTSLYVIFENSTSRIDPVSGTGASSALDHTAVVISNSFGSRSPRSIENIGNDIGFLDSQYIFLGEVANFATIRTRTISATINRLFESINQQAISKVAAIYYEQEELLLIAVQTGTSNNDHVIAYSVAYKAWLYWDTIQANCFLDHVDSNNVKHLYFISDDSDASYVYELFQGLTDDGAAVNSYYITKEFDLGKFNIEKIFQNWNALFGSAFGTTTVDFIVNGVTEDMVSFGSVSTTLTSDGMGTLPMGTFPMGIEGSFTEQASTSEVLINDWRWHTLNSSPTGTAFQMKFSNSTANENFVINKASLGFIELPYYKRSATKEV